MNNEFKKINNFKLILIILLYKTIFQKAQGKKSNPINLGYPNLLEKERCFIFQLMLLIDINFRINYLLKNLSFFSYVRNIMNEQLMPIKVILSGYKKNINRI